MENKGIRISLATAMCLVVIFLLGGVIIYLCLNFTHTKDKDAETISQLNGDLQNMQDSNEKLQEKVDDLTSKIDKVNETINSDSSKKTDSSTEEKELSEKEQLEIFETALCKNGQGEPFISELLEHKKLSDGDILCIFWAMKIQENYFKSVQAESGEIEVISNEHLKEIAKKYFNKEIDIDKAIKESNGYAKKYSDTEVSICGSTGYGGEWLDMISVKKLEDNKYEIKLKHNTTETTKDYTVIVNKFNGYYQYLSIK